MKLAISLSGDGYGHATRISALIEELRTKHTVIVWASKKTRAFLETLLSDIQIRELPDTFLLYRKKDTVQIKQTLLKNLIPGLSKTKHVKPMAKQLLEAKIEGVICDYEPLMPDAAKYAKLPLVLINHQSILDKIAIPKKNFDYFTAKFANRFMLPSYGKVIISSFYEGTVGPIIRSKINKNKRTVKPIILVYAKENIRNELEKIIKEHYSKNRNYVFFPNQKKNFLQCLHECQGVISSAGHQMICEALYLEKPILVLPEKNQYEQYLNAFMLEQSGMGMVMNRKNIKEKLQIFLDNLSTFKLKKDDKRFIIQNDIKKAIHLIEIELSTFKSPTKMQYLWNRINQFSTKHIRKKLL